MGTQITQPGDQVNRVSGQTVWAGCCDDAEAGVAWDWVQLSHGIVAMADPLSVITNLRLVGPEGDLLPTIEAARHLNQIVHALPWQSAVERALVSAPN